MVDNFKDKTYISGDVGKLTQIDKVNGNVIIYHSNEIEDKNEAHLLIPSTLSALDGLSPIELQGNLESYQAYITKQNAKHEVIFAAALTHLLLASFDSASVLLERVLNIQPVYAYAWYTFALTCLRGQRPFLLKRDQALLAQERALKAIQFDAGLAQAYCFLAIIKSDYFESKGFLVGTPDVNECLALLRNCRLTDSEMNILWRFVPIPEGKLTANIRKIVEKQMI